ncbi:serine aminopeptidase domain-containing protein [Paraburkholderia aromaticivorans]|uniref:Esterase n=1 Tax=Paraburkholderia aromaticivorans TaxID=2026199 RepID=A0A248VN47_9BURK|nr:alpha/beta fold hydrolase [Paraburkholderia aromaticivorans]ASW00429.1 esterase [Paraburkholderia aromaticivorans]
MTPVTFGGCFGWLHRPAGTHAETGVVLCNPFGYEALCTYRGWREFADRLAARGIAVLRFDYPGTGDSSGNEDDPQRMRAWLDSIEAAALWLRQETAVTRLGLCGLRFGATLAALAAEQMGGVDDLVLLMPVTSGKGYIRELALQHHSWRSAQQALGLSLDAEADNTVGAHGFRLYADTLEPLAKVDLERTTHSPARRVLLHDLNESARLKRMAAHYQALGAQTDLRFFGEYDKFLVNPTHSEMPAHAFASVLAWLGADALTEREPAVAVLAGATSAQIVFAHGRETPVVFEGGGYAGVFCQPRQALETAPAVLFVNTGGVHRVGDGRFTVLMARYLAAQGIASLRMDLSGLGDSQRRDAALSLDKVYEQYAVADAQAGVDWLVAAGYPEIVMFGVCTGAYVSLHTARAHPAVVGCAAVNLPFFSWDGARTRPGARHVAASVVYRRAMRNPRKWLRLLSGEANGRMIATELARRLGTRMAARAGRAFEWLLGQRTPGGMVRALMRELERKGVQTTLIYGSLDEGLDALEIHFGPRGNRLSKLKHIDVKLVGKVDHALFSQSARHAVMAQFEQFLRERMLKARRSAAAPQRELRVARA